MVSDRNRLLEISGAILLLIPRFAIYGVGILIAVMLGAGYTHVANGERLAVLPPLIFLGFLILVGWSRREPVAATGSARAS